MGITVDSLRTLVFRVAGIIAGLGLSIITARVLGPEGRGIYTLVTLVASLYSTLFGSISSAIVYQISKQKRQTNEITTNAFALGIILGLATLAGFFIAFPYLVNIDQAHLIFIGLAAPILLLIAYINGAFLGTGDIHNLNYSSFFLTVFTIAFMVPLLIGNKKDAGYALLAWLLGQSMNLCWALWRGRQLWYPIHRCVINGTTMVNLLSFGMQIGIVNLISFLNYRVDSFLVESLLGNSSLGIYSIAVMAAELLWFFSSAISTAAYARIGQVSENEAAELTAKAVRHTLFLVTLAGACFFMVAKPLVLFLYGQAYGMAITPLRILLPGTAAYALASIISAYFTNQLGMPRISLELALLSLTINIIVSLLMIPRIGIAGGAWATTISYIITIIIGVLVFRYKTSMPLRNFLLIKRIDLYDYIRLARSLRG